MKNIKLLWSFLILFFLCERATGQWTAIASVPGTATDGAMSFSIDGKGYVAGGNGRNSLYMYDPTMSTWTKKANIPGPSARAWSAYFTVNNKAYVAGGDTSFGALLKDMWAYDPASNTWTQKADFPGTPRDGMLSFVINNMVYVGGGFDGQFILDDFYKYDPSTDTWTTLNNLPNAILFPSTFVIDGKGYATFWEGGGFFNTLIMYDPSTDTWTTKTGCPGTPRGEGIGFTINGRGYAGLGQTDFNKNYFDMYVYNPSTDDWTTMTDTFPSQSTGWSTAFVIGNSVYAGTGTSVPDFNFTTKFYKYTITTTGVQDVASSAESALVYPNPASNSLHISTKENIEQVELYDLLGNKVLASGLGNNPKTINITSLQEGLYIAYLYAATAVIKQKVVVKH